MNKYGLHNMLKATEGNVHKLAEILIQASQLVSDPKGCHQYSVSLDHSQKNTVWISEIWDSKEDHDNSLNLPGVRDLIGQAMALKKGLAIGDRIIAVNDQLIKRI